MSEFNDRVIAEFRASGGRVDSAGFGPDLILLHTKGTQTRRERINPALSLHDGDGWLVVASAKGAPRDPAWADNLRAQPDIRIEVALTTTPAAPKVEVEVVEVTARELRGAERRDAFVRFVAKAPSFETYQRRAGRVLPVFRLSVRAASSD